MGSRRSGGPTLNSVRTRLRTVCSLTTTHSSPHSTAVRPAGPTDPSH
jgi:hypothetical protein